uniref:BTB domain-containing protein n=1 Tax=Oryza brachyantha TaxID=4533 RepID=J3MGQ0_ORYBR
MQNGCVAIAETGSEVRLLKIDGYSLAAIDKDACIKSRWAVEGYDWEVHFFPSAMSTTRTGSPCVQLQLIFFGEPRTCSVKASLRCQLVDPSWKLKPYQEKVVSEAFSRPGQHSAALVLCSRNDLSSLGYLKGDCLTVQCTITVLRELPEPVAATAHGELRHHFGELLQEETGTDVTFDVSGESFAAHKLVLAARSPVFMAEFFGSMKEAAAGRVKIDDMEPAAFKAMLHFIYTDAIPELDTSTTTTTATAPTTTMAMHLLAGADRYGLDRLRLICESKLAGCIGVDTVSTTLALAEQHGCLHLKTKCVEFIAAGSPEDLDAVLATEGYKHLERSCPSALTELLKAAHGKKN